MGRRDGVSTHAKAFALELAILSNAIVNIERAIGIYCLRVSIQGLKVRVRIRLGFGLGKMEVRVPGRDDSARRRAYPLFVEG